ncbi:conjugal transfer protein TraH [Pelomicrobium methylotrophicum]|nr:conjugal transfer protein TraH [Pelomicrobium methylotrophicum]
MQSWFDSMGVYGNVTGTQALKGQTGTTFFGGNLYMRAPQRNYSLFNVAPPSIKAGCGGIDLFAGAFSFMNAEQITALLRNMANNAIGVAFQLAVESAAPELAGVLKWAQDQAAKMNSVNLNSCQLSTGLMTASWPDRAAAERVARRMGLDPNSNIVSDTWKAWNRLWTEAPATIANESRQYAQNDSRLNDSLGDVNVTWSAMNRVGISDSDVRDLMMSMIGTVIITRNKSDGSKPDARYVKLGDNVTLRDWIGDPGAAVTQTKTVMTCPNYDCLNPGTRAVQVLNFARYVRDRLDSIVAKVRNRQTQNLSPGEYMILQGTYIPVWKLAVLASRNEAAQAMLDAAPRAIALDIAYTYLSSLQKEMDKALLNSQATDSPTFLEEVKKLQSRLAEVRAELAGELRTEIQQAGQAMEYARTAAMLYEQVNRSLDLKFRTAAQLFGGVKAAQQ